MSKIPFKVKEKKEKKEKKTKQVGIGEEKVLEQEHCSITLPVKSPKRYFCPEEPPSSILARGKECTNFFTPFTEASSSSLSEVSRPGWFGLLTGQ